MFRSTDSEVEIADHAKDQLVPRSPSLPFTADITSNIVHKTSRKQRVTIWSCAAITGYEFLFFDSKNCSSVSLCGFCGATFRKSSDTDWTWRKKHCSDIHRWDECDRDKQFYRADHFRQHLKHTHLAVPGWWSDRLERSARRDAQGPQTTDILNHPIPDGRGGSFPHRPSLASPADDTALVHTEVLRRSSSTISHTNPVPRVHSDVSEYDAQGKLRKRTVTTSYTSLSDAASASLQRHQSSPGPQEQAPLVVSPSAPARNIHLVGSASVFTKNSKHHTFSCPFCADLCNFATRTSLIRHMCERHPDCVALPLEAQEHEKLKRVYQKRTRQLRWALRLLSQDKTNLSNSDNEASRGIDRITQMLKGVELDLAPSSSEDSEDFHTADVTSSNGEEEWQNSACAESEDEASAAAD